MKKIIAYTDGSAVTKYPYLGGFGVYIKTEDITFRKGYFGTKTGRMELMAVIYTCRAVKNKSNQLIIYSDSQYVCRTCNEWIDNWEKVLFEGKKNVDLLKQLIFELRKFKKRPKLIHIKGHQEITDEHTEGNNIADLMANYKSQKTWEEDVPLTDLSKFEEEDFKVINGKKYYKNGRLY